MAAPNAIDAHNTRVRNAMILPFKRRMLSLNIRSGIWQETLGKGGDTGTSREEARARALHAIDEVDAQVTQLNDLKLPGEKKAKESEAEVQELIASFGAMRQTLVGMTAAAAKA